MKLTRIDQWINWKHPDKKPIGSINKVRLPFNTALQNWLSGKCNGIGFILTINDPFVAVDIDDCVMNGIISKEAQEIIDTFDSYTELSPSGRGIHIWVEGNTKKPGIRKKDIEMYSSKRYMTVTLNPINEKNIRKNQEAIEWLEEVIKHA